MRPVNPTAAIYCKTGECEIRITARAQNDAEAQTMSPPPTPKKVL